MKRIPVWLAALSLVVLALTSSRAVFAAGKITLTPSSSAINEGQSVTMTIQLDQPIIATPPGDVVNLTLTSSNPSTTSFSTSSVSFAASEWAQAKTFIVTMPNNGTYGDSRNVLVMAKASSGSLYYNGFAASATVSVTDMTPEPPFYPTVDHSADDPYSYPAPPHVVVDTPVVTQTPVVITQETPKDTTVVLPAHTEPGLTRTDSQSQITTMFESRFFGYLASGSPAQKSVAYLVLVVAPLAVLLLPLLYLRRRKWTRRQKARHLRWMERNTQKHAATHKKPVLKKKLKKRK